MNTMHRISTLATLIASFTMACGTTTQTWSRVETRQLDPQTLPSADTTIDASSRTHGSHRTTRVALQSGEVIVLTGDARLYRADDTVLLQPQPTSVMIRELAADSITSIHVSEVLTGEREVSRSSSKGETLAIILGVGALAAGMALVAVELDRSTSATGRAIGQAGGSIMGGTLGGFAR